MRFVNNYLEEFLNTIQTVARPKQNKTPKGSSSSSLGVLLLLQLILQMSRTSAVTYQPPKLVRNSFFLIS